MYGNLVSTVSGNNETKAENPFNMFQCVHANNNK